METNNHDSIITKRDHPAEPVFDLILLQTFVRVVDRGGFTAAAEDLHLAQSTVSAHLARLEEHTGLQLLERGHNRVAPTAKGERLLAHARRMLRQSALAWQELREERLEGRIRLGIPEDYVLYLPESLGEFEARFPGVELETHCGLSVDLIDDVQSGALDLAVVTRQPNSPGGKVLRREPLVWAGAPDHDLSHREPLPLALYRQGVCVFRERALAALDAAGRSWRIAYTGSSLSGIRDAVRAGLAVTVLMPSMLGDELRRIDEAEELPALPSVEIAVHFGTGRPSNAVRELHTTLQEKLGNVA
jgi:DNA-binding transcriptional LysR family regulator